MALIFWDGLDSYNTMYDLIATKPYINQTQGSGFGWECQLNTTNGRFGTRNIESAQPYGGFGYIQIDGIASATNHIWTGRSFSTQGNEGILGIIGDGHNWANMAFEVYVYAHAGGVFDLYNGNGNYIASSPPNSYKPLVWNTMEARYLMSTTPSSNDGIFELWVNDQIVMNLVNINTKTSANSTHVFGVNLALWDGSWFYRGKSDDIYILDTTGLAPWCTRLGDNRIISLGVTSDDGPNQAQELSNEFIPVTNLTVSNSGKTIVTDGTGGRATKSYVSVDSGKHYFEVKMDVGTLNVGVANKDNWNNFAGITCRASDGYVYRDSNSIGVGDYIGAGLTTGDILCCALDASAKQVWFRKNNGNWNGYSTANPANGHLGIRFLDIPYPIVPHIGTDWTAAGLQVTVNMGQEAFSYTVPSGYTPYINATSAGMHHYTVGEKSGWDTLDITLNNSNDTEIYQVENPPSYANQIIAVATINSVKKTGNDSINIQNILKVDNTVYAGSPKTINNSFVVSRTEYPINPATSLQWLPSEVSNTKIGIKVV